MVCPSKPLSVRRFCRDADRHLRGSADVAVMAPFHSYSFGACLFRSAQILQWGALWLTAAILIALPENFSFADTSTYTGGNGIGFGRLLLYLSAIFALVHLTIAEKTGSAWPIYFLPLLWAFTCGELVRCGWP